MKNNHRRTATLRVVKTCVDVERQKSKRKTSSQVVTASVLNETLTLYLKSARTYMKFVCEGLSENSLSKSDLLKVSKFLCFFCYQMNKLILVMAVSLTLLVPKFGL